MDKGLKMIILVKGNPSAFTKFGMPSYPLSVGFLYIL